eukprot:10769649-Prorocentrum_lima.AAC.1
MSFAARLPACSSRLSARRSCSSRGRAASIMRLVRAISLRKVESGRPMEMFDDNCLLRSSSRCLT